ncbi:MAG TPA: hypothetical protein VIV15_02775, partial [Anaerolineales bacterium]
GTGSTDNASFNISGARLRTSAVFNFLVQSSYSIRVRSTDQGGLFTEKAFTITVTPGLRTLTITKSGTGSGRVTSSPTGINCGSNCSGNFAYNTIVTLTAAAATGSTFVGWSGPLCSGTGTCVVTMSAAQTVNAVFSRP